MARLPRLLVTSIPDAARFLLDPQVAHRAAHVLRLDCGAQIALVDGHGGATLARILAISGSSVEVERIALIHAGAESALRLVLLMGIPKADKLEWVIQKAAELGALAVVPVETERSVVRLNDKTPRKLERWREIAREASRQSERAVALEVREPRSFEAVIAAPMQGIVAWEEAAHATPLPHVAETALDASREIGVLIGPEGGLAPAEVSRARAAGLVAVSLGPRVLRTETAAIVALSLVQAAFGDL